MGKKKEIKKEKRKILISKIYLWIFIILGFFTLLFLANVYAYADLKDCERKGGNAFYESKGPVGYVLRNSR